MQIAASVIYLFGVFLSEELIFDTILMIKGHLKVGSAAKRCLFDSLR